MSWGVDRFRPLVRPVARRACLAVLSRLMRRLVAIPAVLALVLLFAPAAGGCSCEADVVPRLARADGAIVGTVTTKTAVADGWRYTVGVERVYKGTAGDKVELVSKDISGCSDAIDIAVDTRPAKEWV